MYMPWLASWINVCYQLIIVHVCGDTDGLKLHDLSFHKELLRLFAALLRARCRFSLRGNCVDGRPFKWSLRLRVVNLRSRAKQSVSTMQTRLIWSVVISLVLLGSRISAREYNSSLIVLLSAIVAWWLCRMPHMVQYHEIALSLKCG